MNINGIRGYDEVDFDGKGVGIAAALDGQARFNADGNSDGTIVIGADSILKAYGFTTSGRVFLRWVQDGGLFKEQTYNGLGFHLEANYLIAKRVAPAVRYARIMPKEDDVQQEILGGVSAFVFQHKLKAQFDGGVILVDADAGTEVNTQFRTQLQGAF